MWFRKLRLFTQVDSLPAEPQGKTKNTWMGSLSLLQRIFPTQELSWGLPHCRWILYQLSMREAKDCEDGLKYKAVASTSWIVWSLQTYFLSHPLYQQVKSKVVSKAQSCLTLCDPMDCSPYLVNLHAEYIIQNASWMKLKLESRLLGEISTTSDMQITPPLWQKAKKN